MFISSGLPSRQKPSTTDGVDPEIFFLRYLLSGTNAITEDGKLFNLDAMENRVGAMCIGPKKTIVITGVNKIVKDLEDCGKKSKKGFFHYDDQGRETDINEGLLECLPARKVKMSEKDIQERVLLPMINEAAMVLQDRAVRTVEEIDLGLVFGIGFPRFRGGLLRYADSKGLDNILKALDQYARDPDARRFEACALIREMVKQKKTFYV